MKLRYGFMFLVCAALVAAGCGSDDNGGSKDDSKKSEKLTKQQRENIEDAENKAKAVKKAEADFEKNSKDVGVCRNLAMAFIAAASPASPTDPKQQVELPKDRDKNLKKSVVTLEKCVKIDGKDRDVKQMLASTYMATNKYDKAAPLLEDLAKTAKGDERANAYYAWGLAASNAQDLKKAIVAWQTFVKLAPKSGGKPDPRIAQVQQSIKALQTAAKNPAPAAAATAPASSSDDKGSDAKDDSADSSKDDSGSDSSSDSNDDKDN